MGDANGEEGGARVVYLHSSPLVKQKGDRKARMVQLSTNEVCLQTETRRHSIFFHVVRTSYVHQHHQNSEM